MGPDINNCNFTEITEAEKDILVALYFWANGVVGASIVLAGVVMNLIAILILRSENMKQGFNYLVSCLLIINTVFLVMQLFGICYWDFGLRYKFNTWTQAYLAYPFGKICLTAAIFTTVCLAHQRYTNTLNPTEFLALNKDKDAKRSETMRYMLYVIVLSILVNIPRFFCYMADFEENTTEKTLLKTNYHFVVLYNLYNYFY